MLNFCLYKPCAMCLSGLHFQPCAGSEPDCNCCLSNKYTYMQPRSPGVSRVNFHLPPPQSQSPQTPEACTVDVSELCVCVCVYGCACVCVCLLKGRLWLHGLV